MIIKLAIRNSVSKLWKQIKMQNATKAKQKQNKSINGQLTDDLLRTNQYGNELIYNKILIIKAMTQWNKRNKCYKIFSVLDPLQCNKQ